MLRKYNRLSQIGATALESVGGCMERRETEHKYSELLTWLRTKPPRFGAHYGESNEDQQFRVTGYLASLLATND